MNRYESWPGAGRLIPDVPGAVPLTVSRLAMVGLIAAFALAGMAGLRVPIRVQAGVYLLGMVAMNLPHGGYEHFDNLRRRLAGFQAKYVAAYLLSIGAFVALLFLAPVGGLALAVAVAMAKGGFGDVQMLDAIYGTEHIRSRPQRWLAAAVRGGAVMVVPMIFWTGTFYWFSGVMVGIFEPGALEAVAGPVSAVSERVPLLAAGYGSLLVAHLGLGYWRSAGTGSFVADAVETLLLVVYFAVVPVVVAVGLYFPLWYSARQVARTSAVEDDPFADRGAFAGALAPLDADDPGRVALTAWGLLIAGSIATFGLAGALWVAVPNPLGGAGLLVGLVAFWSIFVSIIALPHVVIGAWADRGRGIWYVP
ncbi:MAG: Brp/Blh family beta-carotene 15,15'-dioxygenase [Halobacteriales archaeon]